MDNPNLYVALNGLERPSDTTEAFERYAQHEFANLESYKYFNQTGQEAKQAQQDFLQAAIAGDTPAAPVFAYPRLDVDKLLQARGELSDMLLQSAAADLSVEANRLVRETIANRLHEVGIMLLAKTQSQLSPEHEAYAALSNQLGQNMAEVFGCPEAVHFQGILGHKINRLKALDQHNTLPQPIQDAWLFVKTHLPNDLPVTAPYRPHPDTIAWYRARLEERLAPAREAVQQAIAEGLISLDDEGRLTDVAIVTATRMALQARGVNDWTADFTEAANIDTSQTDKTIFINRGRTMSLEEFDKVIQAHEIDEHVMRRVNGDRCGVPILGGTGCAGYLPWEEGNGKANEGLLSGKTSLQSSANMYYLSGCLALGLDGAQPQGRNFGETFDINWRLLYLETFLAGKIADPDDVGECHKYMSSVMPRLYRIFRGTDGRSRGVVFTKDVVNYYIGQEQVWRKWDNDMQTLNEDKRLQEHELERSAKIDPLRPDHRRVAKAALGR